MRRSILLLGGLALLCLANVVRSEDEADGEDPAIFSARIESCAGWRLNKLPEVKTFIYEDFEKNYENSVFKKVPGKSPEMIFLNRNGEELERVDISKMTREELNKLMEAKGIAKKQPKEGSPVHDEP